MRWADTTRTVDFGDGRNWLWSDRTGRGMLQPELSDSDLEALLAQPSGAPLHRRLLELGLIPVSEPVDWIPARSRWSLLMPRRRALWHACPLERGHGGYPFRSVSLEDQDIELWRRINGARPLSHLARDLGVDRESVIESLQRWTSLSVQAVQLRSSPVGAGDASLARLVGPSRPRHPRTADQFDAHGATQLETYHREIASAKRHFDDRETTFAHVFEDPHPALRSRPFGAVLRWALEQRWKTLSGPVLEVGPGSGALCQAWAPEDPQQYWRLDLSSVLLEAQKRRCPGTRSLLGSATQMPVPDASVGCLISNEVLADLPAGPSPGGFEVTPVLGQERFNTGAFEMVTEVARVLAPGGCAYLSEFGGPDEQPTETAQLDHPEVSIHFGQVAEVARSLGLRTSVMPLTELLTVDRSSMWLSRPSYEAIRAWGASMGEPIQARAYTPDTLPMLDDFEDVWWVTVDQDGPGPRLDRVWCLLLEKPGSTSRP